MGRAQQISRSQSIRAFGRVPSSNCSRAPIAETQSPCGEQMNGKMGEFNGSSNSVCTCQDECEAGGALVFFTPCCFPHVVLPTLQHPIRFVRGCTVGSRSGTEGHNEPTLLGIQNAHSLCHVRTVPSASNGLARTVTPVQ